MIDVCFSIYDKTGRYSKFIGTAMLSLLENINTPPPFSVFIHLLHDNTLTDDNRNKFIQIANRYGASLKFYNVEELCADKIAEIREFFPEVDKTRFSIGMFYRFFIAHILPNDIEKAIYLDADIIVNLDINELWQIELDDKSVGAIPNLFQIKDEKASIERILRIVNFCKAGFANPEDYFNSGVLLLNLRFMRNADKILLSGMKFLAENNQLQFLDQDLLNYCFQASVLKLPVKFNRYVMLARLENEFTIEKMIYHYAGGHTGLGIDIDDPFNRLWWSYFIRTPWFDIDTVNKIIKGTPDSMLQPSAVPTGKSRVFIVDEEHAYLIEKNFSVRYEEEVIVVDPEIEECLQKLTDLMNSSRDKKVFFVGIPNIISTLKRTGFVEDKDFFNISAFYSPAWTNRVSNYRLILAM